jgi:hypothetical protein
MNRNRGINKKDSDSVSSIEFQLALVNIPIYTQTSLKQLPTTGELQLEGKEYYSFESLRHTKEIHTISPKRIFGDHRRFLIREKFRTTLSINGIPLRVPLTLEESRDEYYFIYHMDKTFPAMRLSKKRGKSHEITYYNYNTQQGIGLSFKIPRRGKKLKPSSFTIEDTYSEKRPVYITFSFDIETSRLLSLIIIYRRDIPSSNLNGSDEKMFVYPWEWLPVKWLPLEYELPTVYANRLEHFIFTALKIESLTSPNIKYDIRCNAGFPPTSANENDIIFDLSTDPEARIQVFDEKAFSEIKLTLPELLDEPLDGQNPIEMCLNLSSLLTELKSKRLNRKESLSDRLFVKNDYFTTGKFFPQDYKNTQNSYYTAIVHFQYSYNTHTKGANMGQGGESYKKDYRFYIKKIILVFRRMKDKCDDWDINEEMAI